MKYLLFIFTFIITISSQLPVFGGMTLNGRQSEINPERNAYWRKVTNKLNETREKKEKNKNELEKKLDKKQEEKENDKNEVDKKIESVPKKKDVFCRMAYDEELIKKNYIVYEEDGIRVMMNNFPYGHTNRLIHLLLMPVGHVDHPDEYPKNQFDKLTNVVKYVYKIFNSESYATELTLNWGSSTSQSVPHWHYHVKLYTKQPVALPDSVAENNRESFDLQVVFEYAKRKVKEKNMIDLIQSDVVECMNDSSHTQDCVCCSVCRADDDEKNFIIARFKYNYLCISHYPNLSGELSVVPIEHVSSIEGLSQKVLLENLFIAKLLLPMLKEYANNYIRDCDGANIYIQGVGGKASEEKKRTHHVHTVIMPRTIIKPKPGGLAGHSVFLPFDPEHLFEYLTDNLKNIKEKLEVGSVEN